MAGATLGALGGAPRRAAPAVGFTWLDGSRGSTADLRGQVMLVNLWATPCAACVPEMPTGVSGTRR